MTPFELLSKVVTIQTINLQEYLFSPSETALAQLAQVTKKNGFIGS